MLSIQTPALSGSCTRQDVAAATAGYSGVAWYRLRLNVIQENARGNTQGADEALAISMPSLFDDTHQVYVDGRLAGEFGRFSKEGATFSPNLPRDVTATRQNPATRTADDCYSHVDGCLHRRWAAGGRWHA